MVKEKSAARIVCLDRVLEDIELCLSSPSSTSTDLLYSLLDLTALPNDLKPIVALCEAEPDAYDAVAHLYITLAEALIWSRHSPLSRVLRRHGIVTPLNSIAEKEESLRLLGLELDRLNVKVKPTAKSRATAGSSPRLMVTTPDSDESTAQDLLLAEVVSTVDALFQEDRQKRKNLKQTASLCTRWQEMRAIRVQKRQLQQMRQARNFMKNITQGISRFWKLAGSIAYKRHRHRMRSELAEIKMRRQRQWVRRTEMYSARLAAKLDAMRGRTTIEAGGSESSSAVSSEGWSSQEEEDEELEAEMTSDSEDSKQDDEAAILRRENEMTVEELIAAYKGPAEIDHLETTTATEEPKEAQQPKPQRLSSKPAKRGRSLQLKEALARKRRRLALNATLEGSESSDSSSSPSSNADKIKGGVVAIPRGTATSANTESQPVSEDPCAGGLEASRLSDTSKSSKKRVAGSTRRESRRKGERVGEKEHKRTDKKDSDSVSTIRPLTEVSSLLRATLRPYQHEGFDWLVMLHECDINGILADEMGLGKTVQTIALIAWLASVKGIWGPHLIIVPTSVVLNWEIEFRKFAPGLKILTYFGSKREREKKRHGWSKPFAFHVCITSYSVAIADASALRRLTWYYMVLDEAQNLKNPQSARWQTLLQFSSEFRLLLTGTPIQNNLMELWALMYFLMPEVFGSQHEWKELFADPLTSAIERSQVKHETHMIRHLYSLLRPFLCRRLKKDVENQLPMKIEHVVKCHLTKRQKLLYDELLYQTQKEAVMESGQYLAMMNVLMQLRKICNHPNLLDDQVIETPICDDRLRICQTVPRIVLVTEEANPFAITNGLSKECHMLYNILHHALHGSKRAQQVAIELSRDLPDGDLTEEEVSLIQSQQLPELPSRILQPPLSIYDSSDPNANMRTFRAARQRLKRKSTADNAIEDMLLHDPYFVAKRKQQIKYPRVRLRTKARRVFETLDHDTISSDLLDLVKSWIKGSGAEMWAAEESVLPRTHYISASSSDYNTKNSARQFMTKCRLLNLNWEEIFPHCRQIYCPRLQCLRLYKIQATGADVSICGSGGENLTRAIIGQSEAVRRELIDIRIDTALHTWLLNTQVVTPDRRSVETDSGKLIVLNQILQEKKRMNLKCVIFTQMSRMLDILESFINLNGYTYVRLDGATKPERRQLVVDTFNNDPRIFLFIASTRSGGVGINLVGGSVVIFYDTDWNPAMDRQAMDRCHRLGQSADVHIYRLINEHTIEENIWRKQLQKRQLDDIVVDQGRFTSDLFFTQNDVRDILFTVDSSTDLYSTRVLHDRPAACDIVLKELTKHQAIDPSTDAETPVKVDEPGSPTQIEEARKAREFAVALTKVEDAEDIVALQTNTKELLRDYQEYDQEFDVLEKPPPTATHDELADPLAASNVSINPILRYAVEFVETVSITKAMEHETNLIKSKYKAEKEADNEDERPDEITSAT